MVGSAFVVGNFDTIAVESLAVKNMIRNRSLSRSIADAGWAQFLEFLTYKSRWYGRELLEAGRFYPSSKTCGECVLVQPLLPLDVREWECPACTATLDRDVNAARNILREALRSGRQSPITDAEAA